MIVNNSANISERASTHRIQNSTTYEVGKQDPDLEQTQKYDGVKSFNWDPIPPLDNWLSKPLH